jgi:hypothetical protein
VVPGLEPSIENCCSGDAGGQLTVSVVRRYPSRTFPIPDFNTPRNCAAPFIVVVYLVTVARCAPVGVNGRPPTCEQLDIAAQEAMLDMEQLWDGVACCLNDTPAMDTLVGPGPHNWTYGDQLTVGPEGGCSGSTLQVLVGYPPCLECP